MWRVLSQSAFSHGKVPVTCISANRTSNSSTADPTASGVERKFTERDRYVMGFQVACAACIDRILASSISQRSARLGRKYI